VDWEEKHWRREHQLHVDKLNRVDGRHGESCRLFVFVVQLVEVFVEEWSVVDAMVPVG